jgi:hypothetical protein
MTGERLRQVDQHRWIDPDEIVSVRVEDGATAGFELVARIGLRSGEHHIVKIPGTHTQPYSADLQRDSDRARDNWLADHLGDLLEGSTR